MSISLTTMRYFVEAARCENFSEAANRLYTTQPNLSKKISGLEKELGVELFRREGRHVHLTEAGQFLSKDWSDALEKIERSILQTQKMERNRMESLTVGILEGMEVNVDSLHRIDRFRGKYPHAQIRMERTGQRRLWQDFSSGRFDVIVSQELQNASFELPSGCARQVIGTSNGVIAINTQSAIAETDALTLPMLAEANFIVLSREEAPQSYQALRDACRRSGFEPRIVRETDSIETLLLYVETGAGVALLSGNSRLVSNPNIRFLPLHDMFFDTVVYWHVGRFSSSFGDILSSVNLV